MRLLDTITGEGFTSEIWQDSDGRVFFVADADIDCDGGSNPHHDPCWQRDTSLHFPRRGQPGSKPIDSERVPGIVVPPIIVTAVAGIVLGCRGRATKMRKRNGLWQDIASADAVVFDTGPTRKDGELTPALAKLLGIDPNPNTGGEDAAIIRYELWPGVPAVVDGLTYDLQPHG